jgi:hypothetical protein
LASVIVRFSESFCWQSIFRPACGTNGPFVGVAARIIEEGSGSFAGSGQTTATNLAVTRFLSEMFGRRAFHEYFASFPILGVEGSLATVTDFES